MTARSSPWRTRVSPRVSGGSTSGSTRRSSTRGSPRSSRSSSATRRSPARLSERASWRSRSSGGRARQRRPSGRSHCSRPPRAAACSRSRDSQSRPTTSGGRASSSGLVTSSRTCCAARASSATESSPPLLLVLLGHVELELGELQSALSRALAGQEASEQAGQHTVFVHNLALESLVEAQRGRAEQARAAAQRALGLVPETGGRGAELVATAALGHLELVARGAGRGPGSARADRRLRSTGSDRRARGDPVRGRPRRGSHRARAASDEAVELLDWYEGNARRLERASGAR